MSRQLQTSASGVGSAPACMCRAQRVTVRSHLPAPTASGGTECRAVQSGKRTPELIATGAGETDRMTGQRSN